MNVFEIIKNYYFFVAILVGVVGSLAISISDEIYEMDLVLTDKKEFVRCIFMYQFAVYYLLKGKINKAGMIILEIFVTLSVWFLNVIVFAFLLALLILRGICCLFWLIFRVKEGDK